MTHLRHGGGDPGGDPGVGGEDPHPARPALHRHLTAAQLCLTATQQLWSGLSTSPARLSVLQASQASLTLWMIFSSKFEEFYYAFHLNWVDNAHVQNLIGKLSLNQLS